MSSTSTLSLAPLVYSKARELWENYARNKFAPLKNTNSVNCYYSFTFAAGSVEY